jgi:hypothetical protein
MNRANATPSKRPGAGSGAGARRAERRGYRGSSDALFALYGLAKKIVGHAVLSTPGLGLGERCAETARPCYLRHEFVRFVTSRRLLLRVRIQEPPGVVRRQRVWRLPLGVKLHALDFSGDTVPG